MTDDDIPPVEELMANAESALFRSLITQVLLDHTEVLHKREFQCYCGEFSVPLTGPDARRLFYQHRAEAIMKMLKSAGVEL